MTSCTLPSGQTTTFTYGADGLRRSMTTTVDGDTSTTDFVYDGTTLVREMQVSNGVNFPGAPVGTLVDTDTYFQGFQGPAYHRDDASGGVPHWYVYNGLGSVVGEVDPAGNYTASGEYDVYGAPRASTQAGTFETRQRFVGALGHQTDPETGGLIYMQARYYDPSTGRFVSEDPSGDGGNWYIYCADNPVCASDSSGDSYWISHGISNDRFMEDLVERITSDAEEGIQTSLSEVMDMFGGDVPFAEGIWGAVGDAIGILRICLRDTFDDPIGLSADADGEAGYCIAEDAGQSGIANLAENANLVQISIIEGEVIETDKYTLACAEAEI